MLREVPFENVKGRLFLTSMPGRHSPFEEICQEIRDEAIDYVVSLTSLEEARLKSPDFARAIENHSLPFERQEFPIPDLGVPRDREGYLRLVKQIAQDLQDGKHIAIHCVGGIGRTGTLATSVMIALGQPVRAALDCIDSTGSHPETGIQRDLVYWIANQFTQK